MQTGENPILLSQKPEEWEVRDYSSLVDETCFACGQKKVTDLQTLGRRAGNHVWNNSPAQFAEALYMELKRLRESYRLDN